MGLRQFKNNASTKLASGIADSDTVCTVTTGEGALFPALAGGQYFYATLESGTAIEIVKVTARSTDQFTIVRAQEGTVAQAFSSGTTVEVRWTAKEAAAILFPEKLAKSANYTAVAADHGQLLACSGTFTLSLTAAATLGDGWAAFARNVDTGVITVDPNGAETIDGVSTLTLYPGESCLIMCDGSNFFTLRESRRMNVLAKTGAYTAVLADHGKTIDATSGTWTLSLTAAATLGDGWWTALRNTGSGTITVDPDGAEQINGAATLALAQNETAIIVCTGSAFKTVARFLASSLETGTWSSTGNSKDTVYQNTSGRMRRVLVTSYGGVGASNRAKIQVENANPPTVNIVAELGFEYVSGTHSGDLDSVCLFLVPSGQYYRVATMSGTINIRSWYQLDE